MHSGTREAYHAGSWYEDDPRLLGKELHQYLSKATKYKNSDGTIEYLLDCKNMGHWGNIKKTADGGYEAPVTKMYGGYILVRPKGNVAHCIFYASTGDECYGESEYVLIESAEYTDVQDITEGAICKK